MRNRYPIDHGPRHPQFRPDPETTRTNLIGAKKVAIELVLESRDPDKKAKALVLIDQAIIEFHATGDESAAAYFTDWKQSISEKV